MNQAAIVAVLALWSVLFAALMGCGADVARVDKDTVKGWLDDPGVIIIDVRAPDDWLASDKKIKGAIRQNPEKVDSWVKGLSKEKRIVLYCA